MSLMNMVIPRIARWPGVMHCFERGRSVARRGPALSGDVARCAAMLRASGTRPGARVGILGENGYAWVVLDLACLACGAVPVGFDPHARGQLAELRTELAIEQLWELPADADPPWLGAADGAPGEGHGYAPGDSVSIKFTSGSTGASKAIEVRRASVDDSLANVQRMFAHGPGDAILVFLPLHLLQQRYWIYSAILFGHDVVVAPYHLAFTALAQHRPTVVMGVPEFFETAIRGFDASDPRSRQAFHRLLGGNIRYLWTGSAPIGLATLQAYEQMAIPLYQGYGMNETCIVAKNHPGHDRPGSVGRVVPSKRVELTPEGEILVWSEHPVADRYANRSAEESAQTFRPDGRVATGDTGFIDDDGYLHITGRAKDIIVLASGRKVAPLPIEARLAAYPSIARAVVFGGPLSSLAAVLEPRAAGHDRGALAADLAAYNATAGIHDRVTRFAIAHDGITQQQGLLTSQFKVRRTAVEQRFAAQLEMLDGAPAEPERP